MRQRGLTFIDLLVSLLLLALFVGVSDKLLVKLFQLLIPSSGLI